MNLVGFITKKFVTMQGHTKEKLAKLSSEKNMLIDDGLLKL